MSFADGKLLWLLALCEIMNLTLAAASAQGPALYAVNFNAEETVEVDRTINLTVQITNDNLSLTSGPTWYRIYANLPKNRSHTENNFKDGNNYTTLIIDKASYADDGGTYCLSATNQFNTSTICVIIYIYKDVSCYADDEPVPILNGSKNHTTVEGEMITFKFSFGDNYSPINYDIYWELALKDRSHITVMDYINYTDFRIKTFQDCPPSNYSCCRFTTELSVHTNLSMDNAVVSCVAIINELISYSSSDLSVVVRPTIAVPLTVISAEERKTVNLDCSAIATTMSEWTMFSWLKNGDVIRSNPNKYSNITEINPDKSNENSLKSILTIYDISKEDEADYTCIVYYDPIVLQRFGINDKFSNQTTAALEVEQGWPQWKIIVISVSGAVALAIIGVVTVALTFCAYRRRVPHGDGEPSARNVRNQGSLDETSHLLQSQSMINGMGTYDYHSVCEPIDETPRPQQVEEGDDVETNRPFADIALLPPSQQQNSSNARKPAKVDMIILLLLIQTENNKLPPSGNDGWLEDVSELLERIKPLVQLGDNEQNAIYDQGLEPDHRSLHLYKVIKEQNKINEVSILLYRIYYANRRSQVAAHGSDDGTTSPPPAQPGNAHSQEIHHHHHHHHFTLQIEVTTGSILHRLEEFVTDTDDFANPLSQHAPDFMRLVDTKTLSPALIKHSLLSPHDMEFLQLQAITDSEKVSFIYVKLWRLGKEGYDKFKECLKHPYAMQHIGHKELYHKLSSQQ